MEIQPQKLAAENGPEVHAKKIGAATPSPEARHWFETVPREAWGHRAAAAANGGAEAPEVATPRGRSTRPAVSPAGPPG